MDPMLILCVCPRDFIRYVLVPVAQSQCLCMCVCLTLPECVCGHVICAQVRTLFAQTKLVCLNICMCIGVYVGVNLLLMLGRYSGTGVALRGRIASLLTEQSTSCPLYKQTGYNDQYGYQTRPTVGCVCVCLNREGERKRRQSV